jgi:hypothetical protein
MQYPLRRTHTLIVFFVFLVGCAVEEVPDPCEVVSEDFGLDVQMSGLEEDTSYYFEVEADGGYLTLVRSPDVASTFVESPLSGGRTLLVVLMDDVLRLAIQDPGGSTAGPELSTVRIHASGELLIEASFEPSYADIEPTSADCDAFQVQTEMLEVD